jgi:hypothetical protein
MKTGLKKKSLLMVMALLMAVTFFTFKPESQAADTWSYANVLELGTAMSDKFVQLTSTEGYFYNKWFSLYPAVEKEQLATILTAISLGKTIHICVDLAAGTYPQLKAVYLAN